MTARRDALLLVLLGAIWGAVFPLASLVLQEMSPMSVVVARTGLSAVVLVPLALRGAALLRELRRRPGTLLIAAVIQMTIPVILLTVGQQHVSAGLAGILLGTQPVWATIFVAALDGRLHAATSVGVGIGLAGVVMLFWTDLHGGSAPLGGLLLVGAAAGYAAGAVHIQRNLPDASPNVVAASALAVSCLLLAPTLPFTPTPPPTAPTVGWLVLLGTIATGGALVLFYHLIDRIGAVRANLAAYLAPGFAVLYDIPLGHIPTVTALIGLALILVGSALAARNPERPQEAAA